MSNPAAAVVAGLLGEDYLIYHCVDECTAFTEVAEESLASLERSLLSDSNLVIVSAQKLYESNSPFNRNTILVRHGIDHATSVRPWTQKRKFPTRSPGFPAHRRFLWVDRRLGRCESNQLIATRFSSRLRKNEEFPPRLDIVE